MKLRNLFHSDFYHVIYRKRESDGLRLDGNWHVIRSNENEWFADPFLFEWEGKQYIFAERMNRWRLIGSIAVCEINDLKTSRFREVLVEPFHLSFPNVFAYNGEVYMIPESGQNQDIRLYKSKSFPYQWELVKVLYTGRNYVDTSFVSDIKDGHAVLCSLDWDTRHSYYFGLDLNHLVLTELPENPGMMNERNGGNCFEDNSGRYRVLQDCSSTYGAKILINRIDCDDFEQGNGRDSLLQEIRPQDLQLEDKKFKPLKCHTFNRSSQYDVMDILANRFIWLGPFSAIRNKLYYEMHKG